MVHTNKLSDDVGRWKNASIVSVEQFDEKALTLLIRTAEEMRQSFDDGQDICVLRGRILGCLFFEPSTRTSCSFQAAMLRLGGGVINVNEGTSSAMKGETFEDTIRSLECYCDGIVLRHPAPGTALRAAEISQETAIINAGDGVGEHPTQALLDLYTLFREFRTSESHAADVTTFLCSKRIALVGDLKHGRTVHSLARLLARFDVELVYVSPKTLEMPSGLVDAIASQGLAKQSVATSLGEVIHFVDAVYVTRIQKERFEEPLNYEKVKGSYSVDPEIMKMAKSTCVVLHPLPRVDEIPSSFDTDPRAAYFRQMQNGMFLRMALLRLLL
mmetsp:Transcript_6059/g.15777  ORF Transcript_6059/g.15777 Transcript_6059/m.15777 type:complete len:329 (-) Transcript_6059:395-1381(-)|eukprot:CAMPEP_0197415822 /NCGR_PEP_ID=MMETSP1170-20131217/2252_1 /TAXON_ID=54406 /ORGANISM="Sarcinochrysis sp, Strain CCMP770" /LENGTH=328 /DNA_ID=CAMNT_0042942665 /DNA_START=144 /DNA_END=1130 /DNA_ORIENTATION=-